MCQYFRINCGKKSMKWALKMGHYALGSENHHHHVNQEVQIFTSTLRTLVKLHRPLRVCKRETNDTEACATPLDVWCWHMCPGQRASLDTGSVAQKRVNFCCTCLKIKGFDVEALVMEHLQVNKVPSVHIELGVDLSPMWAAPVMLRWFLLRKKRLLLNEKRRLDRRKGYPQRKWRNKNLQPKNQFNQSINKIINKINSNKSF